MDGLEPDYIAALVALGGVCEAIEQQSGRPLIWLGVPLLQGDASLIDAWSRV